MAPKKPYSLLAMLDDILRFAAETLVDGGRLSFWIPTANDEDQEILTPSHPYLRLVSVSTQTFNKCKHLAFLISVTACPNFLSNMLDVLTRK